MKLRGRGRWRRGKRRKRRSRGTSELVNKKGVDAES